VGEWKADADVSTATAEERMASQILRDKKKNARNSTLQPGKIDNWTAH
jgi:hypothetical protein